MQETMLQNRKPVIRSYRLVGACIAVGFIASICIGNYPISVREIISILTGGEVSAMTRKVFFTLRLPRTCMGDGWCGTGRCRLRLSDDLSQSVGVP